MTSNVIRVAIGLLVLLELFALFLAISVLSHGATGSALLSVAIAVVTPLIGLFIAINAYRKVRARL